VAVRAAEPEAVLVAAPAAAWVAALVAVRAAEPEAVLVAAPAAAWVAALVAVRAAEPEAVLVAGRLAAGLALADMLVVPAEVLGEVPAAVQAVATRRARLAPWATLRPTQRSRILALLGDLFRQAVMRVSPPWAPRRKMSKQARRDPAAIHRYEADFISLGSGFLYYTPV